MARPVAGTLIALQLLGWLGVGIIWEAEDGDAWLVPGAVLALTGGAAGLLHAALWSREGRRSRWLTIWATSALACVGLGGWELWEDYWLWLTTPLYLAVTATAWALAGEHLHGATGAAAIRGWLAFIGLLALIAAVAGMTISEAL